MERIYIHDQKENFEKEGRYSVTIDSEDKATNKMNNKVKSAISIS